MPEEPINNNPNQPTGPEGGEQPFNNFNNENPSPPPVLETPTEPSTSEDTIANETSINETNADGFVANPVVNNEAEANPQPFMAPESLPVQSAGSEPTLPPNPEVPSTNKLLVPILIAAIAVVVLAVAGYFLAKYLF